LTLLVGWQEGHPACKKTEWWGAGMVICLERDAVLHMVQLMPLPLTVSCFSKIQIGFTFLVPAHTGNPGQRAVKRVCVHLLNECYCCVNKLLGAGDMEADASVNVTNEFGGHMDPQLFGKCLAFLYFLFSPMLSLLILILFYCTNVVADVLPFITTLCLYY